MPQSQACSLASSRARRRRLWWPACSCKAPRCRNGGSGRQATRCSASPTQCGSGSRRARQTRNSFAGCAAARNAARQSLASWISAGATPTRLCARQRRPSQGRRGRACMRPTRTSCRLWCGRRRLTCAPRRSARSGTACDTRSSTISQSATRCRGGRGRGRCIGAVAAPRAPRRKAGASLAST